MQRSWNFILPIHEPYERACCGRALVTRFGDRGIGLPRRSILASAKICYRGEISPFRNLPPRAEKPLREDLTGARENLAWGLRRRIRDIGEFICTMGSLRVATAMNENFNGTARFFLQTKSAGVVAE